MCLSCQQQGGITPRHVGLAVKASLLPSKKNSHQNIQYPNSNLEGSSILPFLKHNTIYDVNHSNYLQDCSTICAPAPPAIPENQRLVVSNVSDVPSLLASSVTNNVISPQVTPTLTPGASPLVSHVFRELSQTAPSKGELSNLLSEKNDCGLNQWRNILNNLNITN